MGSFNIITYLGKNSYPAILKNINESLKTCDCNSLVGQDLVSDCYKKLNESKTPIMEVKEFITKAEQVAGDDVKLCEIIEFCKKSFVSGDFNFLINLCKEDHFAKLLRTGHPSPEQTISEFKKLFSEPSSVIQQGIVNGVFDSLESEMLKNVKREITKVEPQKLNESLYKGSLIRYSPIGIKLEDMKNDRVLLLLESDVITYNNRTKNYKSLNENEISSLTIPKEYVSMMTAINSLSFNPVDDSFSLNESWDFDLKLLKDGTVKINENNMSIADVRQLLLESIQIYSVNPEKIGKPFNRFDYTKDADNFLLLMENNSSLIKFDKLETIKNLFENKYILFDKSEVNDINEPKILSSTKGEMLFESYNQMVTECNEILNENIGDLFESQIRHENISIQKRNNKIVSLNENQKELNQKIIDVNNLKNIAENGSPAMIKLNEQEKMLDKLLDDNINEMDHYKNKWKLYN